MPLPHLQVPSIKVYVRGLNTIAKTQVPLWDIPVCKEAPVCINIAAKDTSASSKPLETISAPMQRATPDALETPGELDNDE